MTCDRCGNEVGHSGADSRTGRVKVMRGGEELTKLDLCARCRKDFMVSITIFLAAKPSA